MKRRQYTIRYNPQIVIACSEFTEAVSQYFWNNFRDYDISIKRDESLVRAFEVRVDESQSPEIDKIKIEADLQSLVDPIVLGIEKEDHEVQEQSSVA